MRILTVLFLLGYSSWALADQWVPYTDGRAGGCFINNTGFMFGCTMQPPQAPVVVEVPVRDPAQERALRQQEIENSQLRDELWEMERANAERQKFERAAAQREDYRRESAQRDAWLTTAEGRAYTAEWQERQRRERTQEAQIQANSQGPNSLKECYKQKKIPSCDQDGCRCN